MTDTCVLTRPPDRSTHHVMCLCAVRIFWKTCVETISLTCRLRNPPSRPGQKVTPCVCFVLLLSLFRQVCGTRNLQQSRRGDAYCQRFLNKTLYKACRMGLTVHVICLNKRLCLNDPPNLYLPSVSRMERMFQAGAVRNRRFRARPSLHEASAAWNRGSRLEPYGTVGSGLSLTSLKC